jgi:cell division ATPase FtsA
LFDFGECYLSLGVVMDHHLVKHIRFKIGASQLDQAISSQFNISVAQAKALRLEFANLNNCSNDAIYISQHQVITQKQLYEVISHYLLNSLGIVKKYLDTQMINNNSIIYLLGGVSKMLGLDLFVKNFFNLNAYVVTPVISGLRDANAIPSIGAVLSWLETNSYNNQNPQNR